MQRQFYSQEDFLLYNMFNHHFFESQAAAPVYRQFLMESGSGGRLALVMDPPFGGKVDVLCHTVKTIRSELRQLNNDESLSLSSEGKINFLK